MLTPPWLAIRTLACARPSLPTPLRKIRSSHRTDASYPNFLSLGTQKVPPPKDLVVVPTVSTDEKGEQPKDPSEEQLENLGLSSQPPLPRLEGETSWKSSQGIYVGKGLPPIPLRLAGRIQKGEFIEMEEMVPELWLSMHQEGKAKPQIKRNRRVTDIFTWIQCFVTYASVRCIQAPPS